MKKVWNEKGNLTKNKKNLGDQQNLEALPTSATRLPSSVMFFNTSWPPLLAQSSSIIAWIRAGTSWVGVGAAAEGGRRCKCSEGAGERVVHTINHVLQAG